MSTVSVLSLLIRKVAIAVSHGQKVETEDHDGSPNGRRQTFFREKNVFSKFENLTSPSFEEFQMTLSPCRLHG